MNTQKITKRTNYAALRSIVEATETLSNEESCRLLSFIDHEVALLDAHSKSSAKYAKSANKASDELAQVIEMALTTEPLTIPEIIARIEGEGVTPGKVSYRVSKLVEAGIACRKTVTIKEEGQGTRRVNGYCLAPVEAANDEAPNEEVEAE